MAAAFSSGKEQIRNSLEAAERAMEMIRDGDLSRRQVSLELRDLQLTIHEDYEKLKEEMNNLEDKVYQGRNENAQWIAKQMDEARKNANAAIRSHLIHDDVKILEKKIEILKDSVMNVNKAYYNYHANVDLQGLAEQISEMAYRTEKKEKELAARYDQSKIEEECEKVFRGAIEGLLVLKSENPILMEDARALAAELRVFRDAASNKNLMNLIVKSEIKNSVPTDSSASCELSVGSSVFGKSTRSSSQTTGGSSSAYTTASLSTTASGVTSSSYPTGTTVSTATSRSATSSSSSFLI